MEKLTITRIGEPQNKSGVSQKTNKPYNFNVVGFQAQEKEGWFNFNYNGDTTAHGLVVGKEYEFVLTSREYNGKTYWSAAFPKKEDIVAGEITNIQKDLTKILLIVRNIEANVVKTPKYPTREDEGMTEDPFIDDTTVPF